MSDETRRRERGARRKQGARFRAAVAELKESIPCADCGGRFPAVCMDFDHRDDSTKVEQISSLVYRATTWGEVEREMKKCDLVCANCHRIRSHRRGQHLASMPIANGRSHQQELCLPGEGSPAIGGGRRGRV